jgi:hypothetical protein
MSNETLYRVATATAAVLSEGKQLERSWLHTIAWQLTQSGISERKILEAFLRGFEQPRLLRLVSRVSEREEPSPFPEPPGKTVTLYKPPLPGEIQARLAYECFLDGFLSYLQWEHVIAPLRETTAHVTLFIPQGRAFDLDDIWQQYVRDEAFSHRGLIESFVLLLNSVQLADRGVGILDVPIVSEEQKQVLSSFYLAAAQRVEKQFRQRQQKIREAEEVVKRARASSTEREQFAKIHEGLIATQRKET